MDLREYQQKAYNELKQAARNHKRILLVLPTGSGKTVIAAHLIKNASDKMNHVLFKAHRKEIIDQTSEKLTRLEVDHGIIMADDKRKSLMSRVQVASVQTLIRRDFPHANVIIVDEAHHTVAKSYRKILDHYPEAFIVGLTATPCRSDGKGLGDIYDVIVEGPSIAELTKLKYLVPTKVFAPSVPDLRKIKIVRGDYDERELDRRVNRPKMIGDIVEHWLKLGKGRKTVCFSASISHSVHITEAFQAAGVKAEHLDGETDKPKREQILERLRIGETEIVSNVGVLQEGWDMPEVSCIILARPTKSFGLYIQMCGRILRPFPGKEYALVLDHAGATYIHGFVHEEVKWSLDKNEKIEDRVQEKKQLIIRKPWKCTNCFHVNEGYYKFCDNCGLKPAVQGKAPQMAEGDLIEIKKAKRKKVYALGEKQEFYRMLLWYTRAKGHKDGYAAYIYQSKFGVMPVKVKHMDVLEPTDEVRNYIKYYNIRRAKSRGKVKAVA